MRRLLRFMVTVVLASGAGSVQGAAPPAAVSGTALTLKTADGVAFQAYRTGSPGARHGILLIHDGWGLTDAVRGWADDLGMAGYRVLALDLYNGKIADSPGRAQEYMAALNPGAITAKYRSALQALSAPGRKIVAMGSGFGGTQALQAALADPYRVAAAVVYDGPVTLSPSDVLRLTVPVLCIFARKGSVPLDSVKAFEASMKRAHKRIKVYLYDSKDKPEAENPAPEYFDGELGQTLWRQTQAFLQVYLK